MLHGKVANLHTPPELFRTLPCSVIYVSLHPAHASILSFTILLRMQRAASLRERGAYLAVASLYPHLVRLRLPGCLMCLALWTRILMWHIWLTRATTIAMDLSVDSRSLRCGHPCIGSPVRRMHSEESTYQRSLVSAPSHYPRHSTASTLANCTAMLRS